MALTVIVSGLLVISWIAFHDGYHALAVMMVAVAGYYVGYHDGSNLSE